MAKVRTTTILSDISGDKIDDGSGAVIVIKYADKRKGSRVIDATDGDLEKMKLNSFGRTQARRGRRATAK